MSDELIDKVSFAIIVVLFIAMLAVLGTVKHTPTEATGIQPIKGE